MAYAAAQAGMVICIWLCSSCGIAPSSGGAAMPGGSIVGRVDSGRKGGIIPAGPEGMAIGAGLALTAGRLPPAGVACTRESDGMHLAWVAVPHRLAPAAPVAATVASLGG